MRKGNTNIFSRFSVISRNKIKKQSRKVWDKETSIWIAKSITALKHLKRERCQQNPSPILMTDPFLHLQSSIIITMKVIIIHSLTKDSPASKEIFWTLMTSFCLLQAKTELMVALLERALKISLTLMIDF